MVSKKHKMMEAKVAESAAKEPRIPVTEEASTEVPSAEVEEQGQAEEEVEDMPSGSSVPRPEEPTQNAPADGPPAGAPRLLVDEDATEQDVEMSIDAKIAASRRQLSASDCLFCTVHSTSIESNMQHMSRVHSFFIPDMEYLVDLSGLLVYLGEKLAVGNVCLYCPNGGKEFGSLAAVRAHMRDRAHCKLAYDTEAERLEVSDYYDFSSSYPDAAQGKKSRKSGRSKGKAKAILDMNDDEWEEDEDMDGEDADEVIVVSGSEEEDSDEDDEESDFEVGWSYAKMVSRASADENPAIVYNRTKTCLRSGLTDFPSAFHQAEPSATDLSMSITVKICDPSVKPRPVVNSLSPQNCAMSKSA